MLPIHKPGTPTFNPIYPVRMPLIPPYIIRRPLPLRVRVVLPVQLGPCLHIDTCGRAGDFVACVVDDGLVGVPDFLGFVAGKDFNVGFVVVVLEDEETGDGAGGAVDAGADAEGGVEDVFLSMGGLVVV